MNNRLFFIASTSLFLPFITGCGSINDTGVTTDDVMKKMNVGEVEGVDSTMLRIATEAEQKGDFARAAKTYEQFIDKQPTNDSYAIRYAENLRKSGQAEKALAIYNNLLSRSPSNLDALEGKGLALLSLADIQASGDILTAVTDRDASRWRSLNAIGIIFATRGQYTEAQLYFDEALKQQAYHPAVQNNKGLVLALAGQHAGALESLFAAAKHAQLPAQQAQADLNAALVYAIAGNMQQAQTMAARHLQGASLQNNLGLYALLSQDRDLATTHLHMALSESKTFYEKAWRNLEMLRSPGAGTRQDSRQLGMDPSAPATTLGADGLPIPPKETHNRNLMPQTATVPPAQPQSTSPLENTGTGVYNNQENTSSPSGQPATKQPAAKPSSGFESLGNFLTNW